MKKSSDSLVCVVILLSGSLWAQSRAAWGGAGWISAGYSQMAGFQKFKDAVQAAGFSAAASAGGANIGGGGGVYLGHLFIGGSGNGFFGADIRGGGGSLLVGSPWRLGEKIILLPSIGIGGASYTLIVKNRPSEAPFNQAVSGTGGVPPRTFSTGGTIGEVSIAFQRFSAKGFLLGLQVGYLRSLGKMQDWKAAGISLKDGPSVEPQSFYIRVQIGGGGLNSRE